MREEKDCWALDAVYSLLASFIDRPLGCLDCPVFTHIHTLYSDIVDALLFKNCSLNAHGKTVSSAKEIIDILQRERKQMLESQQDVSLFTQ